MNTVNVLRTARALIERGWCQDDCAQTAEGVGTYGANPAACRWCSCGALQAQSLNSDAFDSAVSVLNAAVRESFPTVAGFVNFN
jgi:hypothetical protein